VPVFRGTDCVEDQYDIAIVDQAGAVLARGCSVEDRFGEQAAARLSGSALATIRMSPFWSRSKHHEVYW
jgi:hypothetical protein